MKRGVNLYVPGILTIPGDSRNWSGRAVTFTHTQTERRAEKVEYLSGPGFTRNLFQAHRAEKLARTLDHYAPDQWSRRIIGHSNGTDVILDALALRGWPVVDELHLVCAACEADFEKNGLNEALANGLVGRVCVYIGTRDVPLLLAALGIGQYFGFGTLGLRGPQKVRSTVADKVGVLTWNDYGHSDCWADAHFNQTMTHFLT